MQNAICCTGVVQVSGRSMRGNVNITPENSRLIKSDAGARAIMDLREWYQSQWDVSQPFKQDLIDLLWSSKFGEPYQA